MYKYLLSLISKIYFPLVLFCVIEFAAVDFQEVNPLDDFMNAALMTLTVINVAVVAIHFHALIRVLKVLVWLIAFLFIYLMFQSFTEYHTLFIYPNVFKKVLIPMGIPAMYIIVKKTNSYNIRNLINWIYLGLILKIVITFALGLQPGFIWGPDTRLTYAKEAGFLLIPMLYHLNEFCQGRDKFYRVGLDLMLLFVSQHRTVWIAAFIGVLLTLFKYPSVVKRAVPVTAGVFVLIVFLLSMNVFEGSFLDKLHTQVEDIFEYKSQGTGEWRYEQSQILGVRIGMRPMLGWGFEAFEMGEVMQGEWGSEKGTHIHSGYLDPSYYFGAMGILIYWLGFIALALKYFKTQRGNSMYPVFAFTMFSFAFSYQLPLFSYYFCAIGLYQLESVKIATQSLARGRGYQPATA